MHAIMIFPYVEFSFFSARTIRHILYVRRRECVRPRSTTTDHLSPTALVHTAPPRHSRPVTANRPPSPPQLSSPPPPSSYALRLKNYERRHLRMYVRTHLWWYTIIPMIWSRYRKTLLTFELHLNINFCFIMRRTKYLEEESKNFFYMHIYNIKN